MEKIVHPSKNDYLGNEFIKEKIKDKISEVWKNKIMDEEIFNNYIVKVRSNT